MILLILYHSSPAHIFLGKLEKFFLYYISIVKLELLKHNVLETVVSFELSTIYSKSEPKI